MIVGVLCLATLVGCSQTKPVDSKVVEETADMSIEASEAPVEESATPMASETAVEVEETPSPEPKTDQNAVATEQIQQLAGLMGKTAHDVNLALGQPSTAKMIEGSQTLAANYYKVDFCDEVVKVEVDFDVDAQTVNYISFALMYADDVEASKEVFINALTELYGESTIERYMDVKGKQRRDWNDGKLTFDLKYYENNIALDIYPLDK